MFWIPESLYLAARQTAMRAVQAVRWPHEGFDHLPDRDQLRALASRVREAVMGQGQIEEPLDIERLCSLGRFDVEETILHGAEGRLQALLFPRPRNRFSVLVDPEPPGGWGLVDPELKPALQEHRMRFRICHEIAHTFFFDRGGDLPKAIVGSSEAQEHFCDQFASEILVPRVPLAEMHPTARSIVEVQQQFQVSLEAAARAFAETHANATVAIFVSGPDFEPRVQWSNSTELRTPLYEHFAERRCSIAELEDRRQTVTVIPD